MCILIYIWETILFFFFVIFSVSFVCRWIYIFSHIYSQAPCNTRKSHCHISNPIWIGDATRVIACRDVLSVSNMCCEKYLANEKICLKCVRLAKLIFYWAFSIFLNFACVYICYGFSSPRFCLCRLYHLTTWFIYWDSHLNWKKSRPSNFDIS